MIVPFDLNWVECSVFFFDFDEEVYAAYADEQIGYSPADIV